MEIKKLISLIIVVTGVIVFAPSLVLAADLASLIGQVGGLVKSILPILAGIALAVFFWGLVVFIANSGNEQKRDEGKQRMIWGIIALFVLVSIWGIVAFLQGELGIIENSAQNPPTINFDAPTSPKN